MRLKISKKKIGRLSILTALVRRMNRDGIPGSNIENEKRQPERKHDHEIPVYL
jgi:hypothetical protein